MNFTNSGNCSYYDNEKLKEIQRKGLVKMDSNLLSLDALEVGESGNVHELLAKGNLRRRMLDLGLVRGTLVESLMKSPAGKLTAYFISGAVIALRPEDARYIIIDKTI